jgi:hypothetical protein
MATDTDRKFEELKRTYLDRDDKVLGRLAVLDSAFVTPEVGQVFHRHGGQVLPRSLGQAWSVVKAAGLSDADRDYLNRRGWFEGETDHYYRFDK